MASSSIRCARRLLRNIGRPRMGNCERPTIGRIFSSALVASSLDPLEGSVDGRSGWCRSTRERGWAGSPCRCRAGISGICRIHRRIARGMPCRVTRGNASSGPTNVPDALMRPVPRICAAGVRPGNGTRPPADGRLETRPGCPERDPASHAVTRRIPKPRVVRAASGATHALPTPETEGRHSGVVSRF